MMFRGVGDESDVEPLQHCSLVKCDIQASNTRVLPVHCPTLLNILLLDQHIQVPA